LKYKQRTIDYLLIPWVGIAKRDMSRIYDVHVTITHRVKKDRVILSGIFSENGVKCLSNSEYIALERLQNESLFYY